jgi:hypothetical protein
LPYSPIHYSFVACLLFLALGCSENSGLHPSQGTGGAGGSSTGMGSSAGGSEGGTTAWSGVCSEAPCLGPLFVPCQPTGSCVSNSPNAGISSQPVTNCYSNGVKQQVFQSASNGGNVSVTLSQARDSKACFTIKATLSAGGADAYYVFIDGNGRQVATGNSSFMTNVEVITVTCNGGSPVELSQACTGTVNFGGEKCSAGQCSF